MNEVSSRVPVFSHPNSQFIFRPDFVICGGPLETGGVRLFASKELTHAELSAVMQYQDLYWDYASLIPDARALTYQRITLSVHMKTFVIIDAPDYKSAFEHLFKDWSPDHPARKAIGPKDLGIEGSPTGRNPSKPPIGY